MRVLVDLGVVRVAEPDGARQLRDRVLAAGEEMPSGLGALTLVALDVCRLLAPRQLRRLARIEAHRDDVELLADREVQHADGAHQSVEDLRAQHRALVVGQHQNHRTTAEVVAQRDLASLLVVELQRQRQRLVQLLVETDVLQQRGHGAGRRHGLVEPLRRQADGFLRSRRNGQRRKNRRQEKSPCPHGRFVVPQWAGGCVAAGVGGGTGATGAAAGPSAGAGGAARCGRPFSASSSMARLTGMRTVPAFLSIHE